MPEMGLFLFEAEGFANEKLRTLFTVNSCTDNFPEAYFGKRGDFGVLEWLYWSRGHGYSESSGLKLELLGLLWQEYH